MDANGCNGVDLGKLAVTIKAVPLTTAIYDVFEQFCQHRDWPFLPVVDHDGVPVGVVREHDFKEFAYSPFGRDLITRRRLSDFIKPTLVLPEEASLDELLAASPGNPNPDGIVLTRGGRYRFVLLTQEILRLFERKHLDTQVRLVQAQKMEAIGTLAGGIAHDLNNILTPIMGYGELMGMAMQRGEPIDGGMVDEIMVSAKRAQQVVKQILAFSRHQEGELHTMQLSATIKEVLRLIRMSIPSTIDIDVRLAADATVMADASELHRVILNLCTNAYQAMRETGGRMIVSLDRHRGPLRGWSTHTGPVKGDFLRLSVLDTGTGIPPEVMPRIFEPFFTTKKQGEGTGLGLSVVHGIVERCHGMLSVETEVGKGSTFHIYFPCLSPQVPDPPKLAGLSAARSTPHKTTTSLADHKPASGSVAGQHSRTVRVLLVDDEFAITRAASRILPQYGIQLETENCSLRALDILRERATEFDLLVTDQTMPGMTGADLVKQVLNIRPEMPIIMCTGYSETFSSEMARTMGIRDYILKPTDFQQLAARIRILTQ